MAKRYRKTILDEYKAFCGLYMGSAGAFREEVGEFVISYHLKHGKFPSLSVIVENCIRENVWKELDTMYDTYLKYANGEIDYM